MIKTGVYDEIDDVSHIDSFKQLLHCRDSI